MDSYRKALETNPKCVVALDGLGRILAAKGLANEAMASYRRALQIDPDSISVLYRSWQCTWWDRGGLPRRFPALKLC